ncbi:hypothetical protein [Tellurirhabdus bombi]|uniref:hypothetical protein n=1 Tax=Tellurirhabdus bombi TaxID=2907205 RepID=UPI001F21A890|nr:hypothetical protein [Tellurirhabdus bombi]
MKTSFFLASLFLWATITQAQTPETQRRLRRVETRTTTTALYKQRDTVVAMLKNRMALLNRDSALLPGISTDFNRYFADSAKIINNGTALSPADYQRIASAVKAQNYKLKNLRIEEKKATATEQYEYAETVPAGSTANRKTVTLNSDLSMASDSSWRITQMRVTTK